MNKLIIETKSYESMLPFEVAIVYKKNGVFNDMVKEAISTYPQLIEFFYDGNTVDDADAFVYRKAGSTIFLFITDSITTDILVHECTHITFAVFEMIGALISRDSEEFFAYITEAVFRDISGIIKDNFKLKMKATFQ